MRHVRAIDTRIGASRIPSKEVTQMAIGPVQLIALGFTNPNFQGEVIAELEKLRQNDTIRVVDALAVYKSADGEIEVEHLSNLTDDEAVEFGSKVAALVGLGIDGEEGASAAAEAEAEEVSSKGLKVFDDSDAWDVVADIPPDSAAALLLIEHNWAVPLRDAIFRANGFRLGDAFISPVDLVAIGMLSGQDAEDLAKLETVTS
jgi:uncharacterized membrane protein